MIDTKRNVIHLTYRIVKYLKSLSRQEVDGVIARAFNAQKMLLEAIYYYFYRAC